MGYAAITLAIMGFVVGLRFRLKVLLPFVVLLLIGSGIFAVLQGWHFFTTFLTIVAAQAILQVGYFSGILLRWAMSGRWNWRPLF
jgi:hypothetical protein